MTILVLERVWRSSTLGKSWGRKGKMGKYQSKVTLVDERK